MDKEIGLTTIEAARLLTQNGYNELERQKNQSVFQIFWRVISEPMLILLLSCGLIYLFMGEISDSLMLSFCIFIVIGITYYQERKTEKTLETLRSLADPKAIVIRNGIQATIPSRELVVGDIMLIREGDRICADAVIISTENLQVDESLLTGESIPVYKSVDIPQIFSGTMVVGGSAMAKVNAIGSATQIGKIGHSLNSVKIENTLLHQETNKIVRIFAFIALILFLVVVAIYVVTKGSLIQGLLAGLTLSMSMLPEEFPVVLLIFMTLGSWRISKRKVLARRSAVIETLGAATVLCTDKTGTLTENKMELQSLYSNGRYLDLNSSVVFPLAPDFHELLGCGVNASQLKAYDPLEKELRKRGDFFHVAQATTHIKEYPLNKDLLAVSHVWELPGQQKYLIATKGAPEAIISMCKLGATEKKEIIQEVKIMAAKGLRVLACAQGQCSSKSLPESHRSFDLKFLGLLGFVDPVRTLVPSSVKEAQGAGIRVIMITGDYPGTAQFVAREIGLHNPTDYLLGQDLVMMNSQELKDKIKTVDVFARIIPEQKLLIVNALKENGEIVAMTGDGVNDAPALKSAHIGIAMGERGTDVAREASSLVLLNDDFSSIVSAVRLGRRIYTNLKRAMGYILAVHVPIAGMALLPLLLNLPVVLYPAHIAFLELIIDPACSTVFEAEKEEEGIMGRPPRALKDPMFKPYVIIISVLQGIGILATTFLLYWYQLNIGAGELVARSFAFVALVLSNLLLIVVNLSWRQNAVEILLSVNRTLLYVIIGAAVCLGIVLYVPIFSGLFHLTPLHLNDIGLTILVAFASLGWFEVFKLVRNSIFKV
ncbi:MAG: cation-translocating P-type ATPase [bacterium]